jgi:hypothetical protein
MCQLLWGYFTHVISTIIRSYWMNKFTFPRHVDDWRANPYAVFLLQKTVTLWGPHIQGLIERKWPSQLPRCSPVIPPQPRNFYVHQLAEGHTRQEMPCPEADTPGNVPADNRNSICQLPLKSVDAARLALSPLHHLFFRLICTSSSCEHLWLLCIIGIRSFGNTAFVDVWSVMLAGPAQNTVEAPFCGWWQDCIARTLWATKLVL